MLLRNHDRSAIWYWQLTCPLLFILSSIAGRPYLSDSRQRRIRRSTKSSRRCPRSTQVTKLCYNKYTEEQSTPQHYLLATDVFCDMCMWIQPASWNMYTSLSQPKCFFCLLFALFLAWNGSNNRWLLHAVNEVCINWKWGFDPPPATKNERAAHLTLAIFFVSSYPGPVLLCFRNCNHFSSDMAYRLTGARPPGKPCFVNKNKIK